MIIVISAAKIMLIIELETCQVDLESQLLHH